MVARADWTLAQQKKLADLYLSGHTLAECCKLMQTGQVVAMRYLQKMGVKTRPACRRGWSQEKIDSCVRLYESGYTQHKIAEMLQTGQGRIAQILGEQGVVYDKRWTKDRIHEMTALYESGCSVGETARRMGTANHVIRRYLHLEGIRIRPHIEATKRGSENPMWKGGGLGEYVQVRCPKGHPHPKANGNIFEHRLVMEKHVGVYLLPSEEVHHKDRHRSHNWIENLILFANHSDHMFYELSSIVPEWWVDGAEDWNEESLAALQSHRLSRIGGHQSLLFDD